MVSTYATSSEIVSRAFYGSGLQEVKDALYIKTSFKPLATGETITISYSVD
jgi:hypothetical protein